MKQTETQPTVKQPEKKEAPKPTAKNTGVVSGPSEEPKEFDPSSQPIHDDKTPILNDGSGGGGYNKEDN